jgi:hypothetical protein
MNNRKNLALGGTLAIIAAGTAFGGTLVQDGSLSGFAGPPQSHTVTLAQFDTLGGTRQLTAVQLDFLTAVVGGAQTDGSGTPVEAFASVTADYLLDNALIAETAAVIDTTIANTGSPVALSFFDNDTAQATFTRPADLAPWIGTATIDLRAVTQLIISETPPGIVNFSAGGTIQYTVTYDFEDGPPCPGDATGDGEVDVDDIVAVVLAWGSCPTGCDADVNGDLVVDVDDIVLVVLSFGSCSPG